MTLDYLGFRRTDVADAAAAIPAAAIHPLDVRVMHEELRRECKRRDIDFGTAWAQIVHECGDFTEPDSEWARRKNPAGIKNRGGEFQRYYNGVDAARAYLSHLSAYVPGIARFDDLRNPELDPRFPLARTRALGTPLVDRPLLTSVARHWAEDTDYAKKIAAVYARLFLSSPTYLPVLLVAGHRNFDGGNETERSWTDDLARAYLAEGRRRGLNAQWLQQIDRDNDPDDTLAGLWTVATLCNDWLDRQPKGGIMLDLHFEGGGSPGIFCVYPDAPGDSANTIDQRYARVISAAIAGAVGLSVRTSGVTAPGAMSERQTGVGSQGYRLGMFNLTAGNRADSIRLVVEHGSHDKNPDRARIDALGIAEYARRSAGAAFDAIQRIQDGQA